MAVTHQIRGLPFPPLGAPDVLLVVEQVAAIQARYTEALPTINTRQEMAIPLLDHQPRAGTGAADLVWLDDEEDGFFFCSR